MPQALEHAITSAAYGAVAMGMAGGPTTATGWAAFWQTFWVSFAAQGVARALTKKPKNPNPTSQVDFGAVSVRQPIAPWQVVIGRTRVGGVLTFRWISADRKYWHMIITLACHRCQAVEEVWFDDQKITIDSATGWVFGKYSKVALESQIFSSPILPIGATGVTVPATIAGVQDVRFFGRFPRLLNDVSPAAPSNALEYSRSGSVFTIFPLVEAGQIVIRYFTSTPDPTQGSWARVKVSLGDEGPSVQPFPDFQAESGNVWSSDHKQYGHTKLWIRLEANNAVFPTGVPQVTAVLNGALLYDPRSGNTAYSNNAALGIAHYLNESTLGYGVGAAYGTEIHGDDLTAAANSSDDAIDIGKGGTERRYTLNGSFLTSEQPKAVLERMLAACAGSLVNLGDMWHINVGVYHAPTVTLSETHLAGASVVMPMLASRDDGNVNGVRGVFTNSQAKWQPDDFPAIASSTYLADDGGERRWKDIDLTTFVTSPSQAQRLAKIELLRLRQGLVETGSFKLSAWQVVPGRSVARTDAQWGWSAKAFEVLDSELEIVEGDEGNVVIQVKLTLQETAAAIYDWSTSEEQSVDLAPNTTLPDPGTVPAPGNPSISEEIYETRAGRGVASKAIVAFAQSTYPFGASYQLEYKKTSASTYTVLPLVKVSSGSAGNVVVEILDLEPARYDFRVTAIGLGGANSAYASTLNKEIIGLSERPAAPVIRGFQAGGDGITGILTLEPHPALDVRRGGRWRIRHYEGDSPGATAWALSFSIGDAEGYAGDQTIITLPLKNGSYLVKAEDAIWQQSADFAFIVVKHVSVHAFTLTDTLTEDPTFPGAKVDVVAVDSLLKLEGAGLVDGIPDWDTISSLDDYGGVEASGTYTFNSSFNFGAVARRRITAEIQGQAVNVNDLIDDRLDDIDNWLDFDGPAGGGSGDAWVEIRTTDTDPAGAPAWTAWSRLDTAAVECWGAQLRLRMISSDPAYNLHINTLRATAERV